MGTVWVSEGDEHRFLMGRSGDFLHFPFQCDTCWFRNLKYRAPVSGSESDTRLLNYIRRVNLDGMWSREPGTVRSIRVNLLKMIKYCEELGVDPDLPQIGPWPVGDKVEFHVALAQLRFSQEKGINEISHLQYDTIRKIRTAYSHVHEVSAMANDSFNHSFRSMTGKVFANSNCPTQSRFFRKYMEGMLERMGKQTKANMALDYKILHKILDAFELELSQSNTNATRKRWITMCGCFMLLGFVLALRGSEGFMIEAHGLVSHLHHGVNNDDDDTEMPFIVIPLLGRFKNEEGERWHLMLSVSVTESGFEVRKWVERLAEVLVQEGHISGPAFCHKDGNCIKMWEIDEELHNQLEKVQLTEPNLIEAKIDVTEWFSVFRSLRRGSTARADELDLSDSVVNLHNRWRTTEYLKGRRSNNSMRQYYTSLRLTRKVRLKYTQHF